jgi:CelD/BcsL family acetyltransferase involved in cellulose biosynthesis
MTKSTVRTGVLRLVEAKSLAEWAGQWDGLVAAMPVPSPFLRSWWLQTLAGKSALFLLVLDGETLLGGLPLRAGRLAGVPHYRFCGSGTLCPDHLDVVTAPGRSDEVTAMLTSWVRRPGARVLDLAGVVEGSGLTSWLPHSHAAPLDVAPYQPIQNGPGGYLAGRARSFRKTVRRARNRFAEVDACIQHVSEADLDRALDDFAALHAARGDRDGLLAELALLRAALAAGVRAVEVWVDVLGTPTRTLAVSIAFAACGRVSLYQVARTTDRDFDNASTVLNLANVERAAAAGFVEVDLLRGSEEFKRYYAEHVRHLYQVSAAHGGAGVAVLEALLLVRRLRGVAGRLRRVMVRARGRRSDQRAAGLSDLNGRRSAE